MSEKKEEFKINDSENGTLYADRLDIDGASYVNGLPHYTWFFSIEAENYEALLKGMTKYLEGQFNFSDDYEYELVKYLKSFGTKVSSLIDVCKANDIEYYFKNYM